ncbi:MULTISPECIES: AfsR/SARP family transcriptional regulator [Catenuloplanes]|uniref:ATPase/DNA-binding SARP family transcriptional activator n=1 Tax=Catenuloplanes niger TaxID=587534 RepID=A0AAE3ZWN2_9ACTN|nr:BTAD domain-containing putative transcriptional regulator [Catenuloplanes niger]MDR7327439.1 putative ATPase/DNA-binding SARP family transcriptional activator [Catenuloplanes niger]
MDGGVRLRVTLLGAFRVSRGDTVLAVPGARLRALLVRLALAGGRPVATAALIDAIWAEAPPADPAHALHRLVSRLRRALGPDDPTVVAPVTGGYRLAVRPDDVDAVRFTDLAAHGGAAALTEAVALWRDRPGTEPAVVAAVAPAVATRLAHASIEVITGLADAELSLGRAEAAAGRLSGLLAEQPMHERAAALLMDALTATGRQAEALAVYERTRAALADALGVDPGTALRDRQLRLLRPAAGRPSPEPPAGGSPAGSPPAGSRLAGGPGASSPLAGGSPTDSPLPGGSFADGPLAGSSLAGGSGASSSVAGGPLTSSPVVGGSPADGPPLNSPLANSPLSGGALAGLPAPLTSFVGRDGDLARIAALLATGRLTTVVGPGGAGKTRLAVEAAHRHRHEYRDGVRLVDLAAVTDPATVTTAVLAAFGPRTGGLLRRAGDGDLDVLVAELGGRETLLLLDNCEHVIDAVAHLAAALLPRCPGLRVLATSREPLAVDGEALVPLGPLDLPGPDDGVTRARDTAAVRLFAARAAAVRPDFTVDDTTLPDVVRVVRGLDGLPLALELAAARLRTLTLPDLAGGLADRFRLLAAGSRAAPHRHRTLRAVIAWSWDLLDARERDVAERVSVLPGGITTDSATAVCAGAADVPELLAALTDRSLLHLDPATGRYRMLETVREYGRERLAATGTLGAVRDLAAAHVAALIAAQDARLRGPGQLAALRIIDAEYDNALAGLEHRCAVGDSAGAVAAALTLTWYWQMRGRHADAVRRLGEALAISGDGPAAARARAAYLLHRADIVSGVPTADTAGDRERMRALAGRLLADADGPGHHRLLGPILLFLLDDPAASAAFRRVADGEDRWAAGLAHMFQAEIAGDRGALDRARAHVEAALDHFGRAGDEWARAAVLPMRAAFRRYDDLDGARADLTEARSLIGRFGAPGLGDQLYGDLRWVDLHLRRGDTGRAAALLDTARARAVRASSARMLTLVDVHEAALRVRLGELDRARDLLDAADRGLRESPADHARALAGGVRAALLLARDDVAGADAVLAAAHAAAVATGELPVVAGVTVWAAAVADRRGRSYESAVLLGTAARLRGADDRTDPLVRDLTRRCRAALGEDTFGAAYADGRGPEGRAGGDR